MTLHIKKSYTYDNFEKILCLDITDKLLDNARKIAKTRKNYFVFDSSFVTCIV